MAYVVPSVSSSSSSSSSSSPSSSFFASLAQSAPQGGGLGASLSIPPYPSQPLAAPVFSALSPNNPFSSTKAQHAQQNQQQQLLQQQQQLHKQQQLLRQPPHVAKHGAFAAAAPAAYGMAKHHNVPMAATPSITNYFQHGGAAAGGGNSHMAASASPYGAAHPHVRPSFPPQQQQPAVAVPARAPPTAADVQHWPPDLGHAVVHAPHQYPALFQAYVHNVDLSVTSDLANVRQYFLLNQQLVHQGQQCYYTMLVPHFLGTLRQIEQEIKLQSMQVRGRQAGRQLHSALLVGVVGSDRLWSSLRVSGGRDTLLLCLSIALVVVLALSLVMCRPTCACVCWCRVCCGGVERDAGEWCRQYAAQVQELITDEQPRNQQQGFNLLQQWLSRPYLRPAEQEFILEFLTEGIYQKNVSL
jgi:hypothetical protein